MIEAAAVRQRIGKFLKLPAERLVDDAALASLVHESFVLIQLVMDLQEEFGVRLVQEDLADVKTVGQLVHQIVIHGAAG